MCREGLSEVIVSVILFFCIRYCCDERKADGVKSAHLLTFLYNLVKSVILIDKAPVIHLTIF